MLLHFFEHYRPAHEHSIEELGRWIDAHHAEQVEFLRAIVRVPSDTPPGDNAPAAEKAAELLTALGFAVERHPVPADFLRAYGMKSVTNLIVRERFGSGGPVDRAQCARRRRAARRRLDEAAVRRRDRERPHVRARRRGVEIRHRDVHVRARGAARAWRKPARALNGAVELHFTYDEEFGGLAGPGFLLDRGLTKPDYAIAASFSYAVVTAHNGCLQFEVTVHGKSGHGAMPETGRDAFRAGVAILNAIYAEADALKAKKSRVAGHRPPDDDRRADQRRHQHQRRARPADVPARPPDDARGEPRRSRGARARADRDAPPRGTTASASRSGGCCSPTRSSRCRATKSSSRRSSATPRRVFGEDIPAVGVPLYADARLYGEHGVPIVMYGAGPRTLAESNAKRPDENLLLEDLRRATKVDRRDRARPAHDVTCTDAWQRDAAMAARRAMAYNASPSPAD